MKVRFAWYDFWIGAYYDQKKRTLYICPVPMIVIEVRLHREANRWGRFESKVDPRTLNVTVKLLATLSKIRVMHVEETVQDLERFQQQLSEAIETLKEHR